MSFELPLESDWHEEVLAERTRRLESGDATVSPWVEAKTRLMTLGDNESMDREIELPPEDRT